MIKVNLHFRKNISICLLLLPLLLPQWCRSEGNGGTYHILNEEKDALRCRLDLIAHAEKEILLSYYIFEPDYVGLVVMEALLEAAARGVKIKMLIDGNKRFTQEMAQFLYEHQIEVCIYNRGKLPYISTFTNRLHDKIFLTDQTHLITGGRNIKNAYYSLDERNFIDCDVYIRNTQIASAAQAHFYAMWENNRVSSFNRRRPIDDNYRENILQQIQQARQKLQAAGTLTDAQNQLSYWENPQGHSSTQIDFYFNSLNNVNKYFAKKDGAVSDSLLYLVSRAQKSICIENPYFAPGRRWRKALKAATERGVHIRVLTNSAATNDILLMQGVYLNMRRRLLNMGLELWEYKGPKMVHMKTFIIDDSISIISSYNVHAVSDRWNTEVAAVAFEPDIAKEHQRVMQHNLSNAVQILPNNRPAQKRNIPFKYRFRTALNRYTLSLLLRPVL